MRPNLSVCRGKIFRANTPFKVFLVLVRVDFCRDFLLSDEAPSTRNSYQISVELQDEAQALKQMKELLTKQLRALQVCTAFCYFDTQYEEFEAAKELKLLLTQEVQANPPAYQQVVQRATEDFDIETEVQDLLGSTDDSSLPAPTGTRHNQKRLY